MLKINLKNSLFIIGLLIPFLLVFRNFFNSAHLVWGDAPYFYAQGLKELISEPFTWVERGNNFGGINAFIWLWPLMFLYGLLHQVFGIGNDLIIRILFYFPAVISAFIGSALFAKNYGYSKKIQFFASFFYVFNTYFLLLIDGGQIGVALAYGIFPFSLLALIKLIKNISIKQFVVSLSVFMLLILVDIRIAAIAFFSFVLIAIFNLLCKTETYSKKQLATLIPFCVSVLGVSLYWVIPTASLFIKNISIPISNLQLVSLLNTLLIFQPHWPLNEFGIVSPPPWYFVGIPILIFLPLFLGNVKKEFPFFLSFLVFAFFAKGNTPPLDLFYDHLMNMPLGFILRDSTKFFIPLLLFSGILIGKSIEFIHAKTGKLKFAKMLSISFLYMYLLFLILPALKGDLNGVLGNQKNDSSYQAIEEKISGNQGFFRIAWFPEHNPLSFETLEKPLIDAKDLVRERPFATMNVGTFDAFNFLHNSETLDWFRLFGIKYLAFPPDPRKHQFTQEEQKQRQDLLNLVSGITGLKREDWNINFPVYSIEQTMPQVFATDKTLIVLGSDDIYEKIKNFYPSFLPENQGFVFLEDKNLKVKDLNGVAPESAMLAFNEENKVDLQMIYLKDYFVSTAKAAQGVSNWAIRDFQEYLKWKYELLINGIDVKPFDFGKGIAFSSRKDETMQFDLPVNKAGNYILAVRYLEKDPESKLTIKLDGQTFAGNYFKQKFNWFISPSLPLAKGKHKLIFANTMGFSAVNTFGLIPLNDFNDAGVEADNLTKEFPTIEIDNGQIKNKQILKDFFSKALWQKVDYKKESPVRYVLNIPAEARWIVLTDNYHNLWKLTKNKVVLNSLPFYASIDGFYLKYPWDKAELIFQGQDEARWGLYFSTLSLLTILLVILWNIK